MEKKQMSLFKGENEVPDNRIGLSQFSMEFMNELAKMRADPKMDEVVMTRAAWLEWILAFVACGRGETAEAMKKLIGWS